MTTTTVTLTTDWQAITDGTEDYAIHVMDLDGDNVAAITLLDGTPNATTPAFSLKEYQGISSVTHPGKVWAKVRKGTQVLLAVNK